MRKPFPALPPFLRIRGASRNNLSKLNLDLPLGCFVALAGVSGSGKSTLLENVVRDGLLASLGQVAEDAADLKSIRSDVDFVEVVMVDQTPLGKTPRSNPALFTDAWGSIRDAFARTDDARRAGFSSSDFSFNSGTGRCEQCQGLGYERVEMQFLADVYAPCPACEGCRFKDEILAIRLDGLNITQVLELSVSEAVERFDRIPRASNNLRVLEEVGLGYLPLGQPLNTLSGGEAQRLKLVKYLGSLGSEDKPSLLLLDEPTTGLHRHDVAVLLRLLRRLVENGHSLIVIEHQPDVLASSDWLVELGPGAGNRGGKVVAQGIPAEVSKGKTPTAPMLAEALGLCYPASESAAMLLVAEEQASYGKKGSCTDSISIIGARENNLKNLSIAIPRNAITVVTGPSGSGKSSLAFDVVFAEGQRRFLESMSSYARQFVEQLSRPEVDELRGITPTVAIEQRVTRGTRKSTVGTITEVAHYLRLLYARVGTQLSPTTGEPVETASFAALAKHLQKLVKQTNSNGKELLLCAPLARGRKGHHRPLAAWATSKGYELLRCDGKLMSTEGFEGLERYVEHDVEVVVTNLGGSSFRTLRDALEKALALGKGSAFLLNEKKGDLTWFATTRVDPVTGEAFPELEPKHFSWNAPRGWCLTCR
ncbi:MAG: excinuclease ABC subunit A, partial [Opitutales bacterium]